MKNRVFWPGPKREFSDVVGGVVLKNFSGGKPPDPNLSSTPLPQKFFTIAKVKLRVDLDVVLYSHFTRLESIAI